MKKRILLVVGLILASCGGGGNDGDSDSPALSANDACNAIGLKVFDGVACSTSASPVAEVIIDAIDPEDDGICSGTLIDSTHVLTAAHCFVDAEINVIGIVLGGSVILAPSFSIHPNYTEDPISGNVFNDAAVVTLPSPVSITPISITANTPVQTGDEIAIYGFGINENDEVGDFRAGSMVVQNVTENHIFAEFTGGSSNPCDGDSGGPAALFELDGNGDVTGLSQVGIVSFGDQNADCDDRGDVTRFTNLQNPGVLSYIRAAAPGVVVK